MQESIQLTHGNFSGMSSNELAKFVREIGKRPPPKKFSVKIRASPDSAPTFSTSAGQVAVYIESIRSRDGHERLNLGGFWLLKPSGLATAPPEAVNELLTMPFFRQVAEQTFDSAKWDSLKKVVTAPIKPGDLTLYQTDPQRKRTFLFNIGDGREIVVFSNNGKTCLLRAAQISTTDIGKKSISPLPEELWEPLYEHESISSVLGIMAIENASSETLQAKSKTLMGIPESARSVAKAKPPPIPRGMPSHFPKSMLPQSPAELRKRVKKKSAKPTKIRKAPRKKAARTAKTGNKLMEQLNLQESGVEIPAAEFQDPYKAQQHILSILQALHREKLAADSQRVKAINKLDKRLSSFEKSINKFGKSVSGYEKVFKQKRDAINSALKDWVKYSSEISHMEKEIDAMRNHLSELSDQLGRISPPAEKEQAWAKRLGTALITLNKVSQQLADADRRHQKQVKKMTEQFRKSVLIALDTHNSR